MCIICRLQLTLPGLSIAAWLQAITAATASLVVSNSNNPELERSDFIGNNLTALGGATSYSLNTAISSSSVTCGGVLKKCKI